ncbi:hypothetical protein QZH41_013403 [Actinostola sp. cb2023]|nr:hypothetical protein QZH41_013403 [Actinostola sp. cb2023]
MNFFRAKAKKRSRKEEDDDNDPCIDEVSSHSVIHDHAVASDLDANIQFILICLYLNPKSKRTMVNWIKDKFNKLLKRNSTESFLPQFGETPAHLKVGRYLLSPDVVSTTQATAPSRNEHYLYIRDCKFHLTEDKYHEFKAAGGRYFQDILPEHIRKYGSGFLNSNGGTLICGILDGGTIQGVYLSYMLKRLITSTIEREFSKFRPRVGKNLWEVEFVTVYANSCNNNYIKAYTCVPVRDLYIVEVHIHKGQEGEIYEDGLHKVFIRREASVEGPLPPIKIKELVLENYKKVMTKSFFPILYVHVPSLEF